MISFYYNSSCAEMKMKSLSWKFLIRLIDLIDFCTMAAYLICRNGKVAGTINVGFLLDEY